MILQKEITSVSTLKNVVKSTIDKDWALGTLPLCYIYVISKPLDGHQKMTLDIKNRPDWKSVYDKINKIVNNDLDPLGVADAIVDEYSGLTFKIYSTLLTSKDENNLIRTIKETIEDSYEVTIPDTNISIAVKKLVDLKL